MGRQSALGYYLCIYYGEALARARQTLKIGVAGSQINMSERYINTGSLYLCTAAFLALGLPAGHSFWKLPYMEWSNLKAWKGIDIGADKALRNG